MLEQSSSTDKSAIKVGVLASSEDQRGQLQSLLEQSGLVDVVMSEEAGDDTLEHINSNTPGVLLIDVGNSDDKEWDVIDAISEQSDIPILFNDSGEEGIDLESPGPAWGRKLAQKLIELVEDSPVVAEPEENDSLVPFPLSSTQSGKKEATDTTEAATESIEPANVDSSQAERIQDYPSDALATLKQVTETDSLPSTSVESQLVDLDINVWVLGASLGGPQAVRQFLTAIDKNLPVAFILAQHIGANHISLLAEQLNRVTAFNVLPGKTGHRLQHGEVILTPADKEISFTNDGYLALKPAPANAIYSPSIDNVMKEVAKRFGDKAGTIVFSGMGDDGAIGCEAIAEHQGIVWAQDIASCVVSSMPDHARKTGKVSYSANPEKLADHLFNHYA